jgi:predicted nucleic acid-binding protein
MGLEYRKDRRRRVSSTVDLSEERAPSVKAPAHGANADFFAGAIQDTGRLIVPTLSVFEVFKRVLQQRGEEAALQAAAAMQQGEVAELTLRVALEAAKLGHELKLALADSVMLATSRLNRAVLWTQDADFKGLEGAKYRAKRR